MELKNRIVVLHFGRFWAYRSVQGRFQIGGGTFVSKYPMGNRVKHLQNEDFIVDIFADI